MGSHVTRGPLVIGHRGASGERPEHTMASYRLAIAEGADFIEPDLVLSKDGALVCRHENNITGTTDVATRPEFADRRATKSVDGEAMDGWFTEDFTLAELKSLRCKERLPDLRPANTAYDGQEQIPTFEEVLALAKEAGVGICPELKHPSYFDALGLSHTPRFVSALEAMDWNHADAPVIVQCFECEPLKRLASVSAAPRLQLISADGGPWNTPAGPLSYAEMITDAGLAEVRAYADYIGVEKTLVIPRDANGRSQAPTDLIPRAHAAGLKVVIWTMRAENYFLPLELRRGDPAAADFPRQHGDFAAELRAFYALGVDAVFSDFPGLAVAARG